MSNLNLESGAAERSRSVERGQRLEYFTIFWNSLESLAALISGFIAGSVALVGFGLDSLNRGHQRSRTVVASSPGCEHLAARKG